MRMCRVAGLAGVAGVLIVATATAAVAQTTTSTTASTTTSTSLEPTTTSADDSASGLSGCQRLFARPAGGTVVGGGIAPVGPPVGRSLRLRIFSNADITFVYLCVLVRDNRGGLAITTADWSHSEPLTLRC